MSAPKNALHLQPAIHIGAASEQEMYRIACWQEAAIVCAFYAAQCGKISSVRKKLLHHLVEHLRLNMRHQPGEQGHEFIHAQAFVLHEAGEGGVVVLEDGDLRDGHGGLAQVLGEAEAEELAEEGE